MRGEKRPQTSRDGGTRCGRCWSGELRARHDTAIAVLVMSPRLRRRARRDAVDASCGVSGLAFGVRVLAGPLWVKHSIRSLAPTDGLPWRSGEPHFDMTNNVRSSLVSARHGIARFHAQIKPGGEH